MIPKWTMSYGGQGTQSSLIIPAEDFANGATVTINVRARTTFHMDMATTISIYDAETDRLLTTVEARYYLKNPDMLYPQDNIYVDSQNGGTMPFDIPVITQWYPNDFVASIISNPSDHYELKGYWLRNGEDDEIWSNYSPGGDVVQLDHVETNDNTDKHYGLRLMRDDSTHNSSELVTIRIADMEEPDVYIDIVVAYV